MAKVRVLYCRNLTADVTEDDLRLVRSRDVLFNANSPLTVYTYIVRYTVHCILYCTVYIVHFIVHCAPFTVIITVYFTVHCNVHRTLYCTPYTILVLQCTHYCRLKLKVCTVLYHLY